MIHTGAISFCGVLALSEASRPLKSLKNIVSVQRDTGGDPAGGGEAGM